MNRKRSRESRIDTKENLSAPKSALKRSPSHHVCPTDDEQVNNGDRSRLHFNPYDQAKAISTKSKGDAIYRLDWRIYPHFDVLEKERRPDVDFWHKELF